MGEFCTGRGERICCSCMEGATIHESWLWGWERVFALQVILRPLLGQIGAYDRPIFSERHLLILRSHRSQKCSKLLENYRALHNKVHMFSALGERVCPAFDPLPNHHFGWKGVGLYFLLWAFYSQTNLMSTSIFAWEAGGKKKIGFLRFLYHKFWCRRWPCHRW